MHKPILCLDFDGVLHSYTSGWKGADVISDGPVPGAIAFLRGAVKRFDVCIFSSRSHQSGGIEAMAEWIDYCAGEERLSDREDLAWVTEITFPKHKPPAMVALDDRAIQFTGEWPDLDDLRNFKPWNKQEKTMGIGEAVKQLWDGKAVARQGWNGPNQFIKIQQPDANSWMGLPYIYITTVQGDRVPWLASQTDILAVDWEVVTEGA